MCGLRTLDLSRTYIPCLPNSISDLEKLNALLLGGCPDLVSHGSNLFEKVLRHLDLAGTIIEEIPQGMESLTNLRRLSLLCGRLKMIPTGTLHRLTRLQQLELPFHLEVPIEEVEALKQLELLHCRLNSVRDLNQLINSRQRDKQFLFYDITIHCPEIHPLYSYLPVSCKRLRFSRESLMESSLDTDENMLPRDVEFLYFGGSGLRGCLLDEFPIPNSVRACEICEEDKIECIMRLEEEFSRVPFQSLEKLQLDHLPNLIGLFKWEAVVHLPPGTFSCLKELRIKGCGKIKKLFPQSLVRNFHNLRSLTVNDCIQMEEIIEDDNNEGADITLPMLKELTLDDLPQLKSICKGKMILISKSVVHRFVSGIRDPSIAKSRVEESHF
ncbi:unnamed protein product [Fraxinus pennsylvanica]|uniref:Disease resistance protein At4g27190-like leucine-rich repeats domain-containing protein n=1 Tax=Fraxinus pennsylvanica TaxID=56036 RepID=A0AAD1ZXI7_9LAMI|nr:unnamed protein product [Fraxinus pennsylvanica]